MKTEKEVFLEAFSLVKNPDTFITGVFALNEHGETVQPKDSDAICWCSIGAIRKCSTSGEQGTEIINGLKKFVPKKYESIPSMNDTSYVTTIRTWMKFGRNKGWL